MPTPRGYQPTEVERLAQRARCQRLYRARRDDPALGLPSDAHQLARRVAVFARRVAANPLPLHPADQAVLVDALALIQNEAVLIDGLLSPPSRSSP